MRTWHRRDGFALLIALWVIVTLGTVVLMMNLSVCALAERVQRRHDQTVGRWAAAGCTADLREVIDDSLAQSEDRAIVSWTAADSLYPRARSECDVSMRPDGRVVLDRADERTLDSLPGMSLEAVLVIREMQRMRIHISGVRQVEGQLSPPARLLMDLKFAELERRTTGVPDRWVIMSRSHIGTPPEPTLLEATISRTAGHASLVRLVRR